MRAVGLLLLLMGCARESSPPTLEPAPLRDAAPVRLVGVEAATPVLSRLVQTFLVRAPGAPVVVELPLPEAGARAALADGAVDAAVLLTVDEGQPLARTRPALVVGPQAAVRHLDPARAAALLETPGATWPSGLPVRPFLRPSDDPVQRALMAASPRLATAWEAALRERRHRVVVGDSALRQALRDTPGSLGITDLGSLRMHGSPLWVVSLEGVEAPALDVAVLTGEAVPRRLRAFLDFAAGPAGRAVATELGYEAPEGPR